MGTKNVILRKPKFIHWNIYKISILLCDSAMIVLQYSFYGNVMLLSYRRALIGHPVENLRVVLTDGATHAVDSSELAFKLASIYAFRQCYTASRPVILELVILVELKVPTEFQGAVAGDINKRKGVIVGSDQEGDDSIITAHWPDKKANNETLLKLAGLFQRNLETFTNHKIGKDNKHTEEILAAGPVF
ncbi:elongation factor G-1, mitochondrial isoform X1 [Arachis hypogaea]|uniref:elongation factor G-1, mitochondrial isoform X1 n=1 Tax=Arachis hypogaea TaxID=3818 RepID=UPI003B21B2EC